MTLTPSLIGLAAGQARTLERMAGLRLQVWSGRLWITDGDDPHDHFVAAGQTLVLGGGRTVIEADAGPARYSLTRERQPQSPLIVASRRITWRTLSSCMSR